LVRRKLERRIAEIAYDPNTLSVVSERAFAFNGVKESVRRKYRRHIQTLIKQTGDVPIAHITPGMLREFRDNQFRTNSASSVPGNLHADQNDAAIRYSGRTGRSEPNGFGPASP
jgi:hypothetical protein